MSQTVENVEVTQTALVTIDPLQYVTETFAPFKERLQTAITTTKNVKYDVTTNAGKEKAKECRALFRSVRIESEKTRKLRKEPIIEICKLLDSHYKEIEKEAKKYEEKHDVAIKLEEERIAAEKAEKIRQIELRKASINAVIDELKLSTTKAISMTSSEIADLILKVRDTEINVDVFGDRQVEAELEQRRAIEALESLRQGKVALEGQAQAEEARKQQEELSQAESKRVDSIKQKIELIKNAIVSGSMCESSKELQVIIDTVLKTDIDDSFAEFKLEAQATRDNTINALNRTMKMIVLEESQKINEANPQPDESQLEQVATDVSSLTKLPEQMNESFNAIFTPKVPTASQMVEVIANHYQVDKPIAHKWLLETDFTELLKAA